MSNSLTRERIEKRLSRMKRLFIHLALTIFFALAVMWSVNQLSAPARLEDDLIPVAVLAFIAHALWVTFCEAKYFIISQEMQREQHTDVEKPKRGNHLVIDDDGELTEVLDEDTWKQKLKREES